MKIYLDDIRTPLDNSWEVVRTCDEFKKLMEGIKLEDIELISLDHDLGDSAMAEWHYGVVKNYTINYDNITEKTGYDYAKWLVNRWLDGEPVVEVVVHSANAVGSGNMMGYINNYKHLNLLEL